MPQLPLLNWSTRDASGDAVASDDGALAITGTITMPNVSAGEAYVPATNP